MVAPQKGDGPRSRPRGPQFDDGEIVANRYRIARFIARQARLIPWLEVGIRRLLGWPRRLGNVAQVDADASPGAGAAAHLIHQHVVFCEMLRRLGMARLPALEAPQRLLLRGRACNLEERMRGRPP